MSHLGWISGAWSVSHIRAARSSLHARWSAFHGQNIEDAVQGPAPSECFKRFDIGSFGGRFISHVGFHRMPADTARKSNHGTRVQQGRKESPCKRTTGSPFGGWQRPSTSRQSGRNRCPGVPDKIGRFWRPGTFRGQHGFAIIPIEKAAACRAVYTAACRGRSSAGLLRRPTTCGPTRAGRTRNGLSGVTTQSRIKATIK